MPVASMEGLELGSAGPASNYGPLDPMEVGGPGSVPPDMGFDNMGDLPPPQPPRDNNQVRSAAAAHGTGTSSGAVPASVARDPAAVVVNL